MKQGKRAWIVLLTVLSACAGLREPTEPSVRGRDTDYAVYAALLDTLFGATGARTGRRPLVIVDSTSLVKDAGPLASPYVAKAFGEVLFPHVSAALPSLIARGAHAAPLDVRALRVDQRLDMVSRATLRGLTAGTANAGPATFWTAFRERFPGASGYVTLSLPGYDADSTHALVAYGHPCGPLCGDSGYVLLERHATGWRLLRRVVTMVS